MVIPAIVGLLAALVQVAFLPAVVSTGWAAPIVPCAVVAAWTAARRPEGAAVVALAAALVLGAISVERAGWFIVALLPALGTAMSLESVAPTARSLGARSVRAVASAGVGAFGYLIALALVGGQ